MNTCNVINLYHATSNFKQFSLKLVYLAIEIHQIVEKTRSLKKRDWALGYTYTCYVNCKDDKYEEIIKQKYFVVKKSQKKINTK